MKTNRHRWLETATESPAVQFATVEALQSVLGSAVVEEFEEVEVSVDALDGTDLAVERNDGNEIGDRCRLRGANSDDEHTFRRRQQRVVERGGVELDIGAKVLYFRMISEGTAEEATRTFSMEFRSMQRAVIAERIGAWRRKGFGDSKPRTTI